jgi:chromosome segregation ATPase
MDHQFRNATIGGFNKQDVLDYLELIAKENQAQTQSLQEQLTNVQEQCRQLESEGSRINTYSMQLSREKEALQQTADNAQAELTGCREEIASLRAKLAESEQARKQLQEQVDLLRPDAEAYHAVKDRSAGMELDAHRRAQGILDQAKEESHQMRAQVQQWMAKLAQEYSELRSQIDATVSHAANELTKVETALGQISQTLSEQDSALDSLGCVYEQYPLSRDKVPAPIPLIEE